MLGTLLGALEVRRVPMGPTDVAADVEGIHHVENGLPVLRKIQIRYRLRIPPGSRDPVERALGKHQEKCPTAATLAGAVAVTWTAEIDERPTEEAPR
jgi:uncharacterized OsmC-like protein